VAGGDAGTWGATRRSDVPTELRAILGAPVEKPCQGKPAIRAALDIPDAVRSLRQGRQVEGRPAIRIGIEIDHGAGRERPVRAAVSGPVIDDPITMRFHPSVNYPSLAS
jgi:hypothetical protein